MSEHKKDQVTVYAEALDQLIRISLRNLPQTALSDNNQGKVIEAAGRIIAAAIQARTI